jgi:hypothetical protein
MVVQSIGILIKKHGYKLFLNYKKSKMKLESLKSSKFGAFKGSELQKTFITMGGEIKATEEKVTILGQDLGWRVKDRYDTEHDCTEYFVDGVWTSK